MPIIRKHKRGAKPSVTHSKKQGGKNNTKRRGGRKKATTKRTGGTKKTRRRRGGNPDERQKEVRQILGSILPDTAARNIAHYDRIIPDHNFKETDSTTPRWRRADDIRAYHQNPRNNGYVFTGEEVVKYYADGYRDDRKRPDGLEMTKSGEEREWYRALEPHERPPLSGAAANYPEEREGPFTANEIANSVFKNTKNKTLSEKMPPGDDRIDKPHYREYATLVGRRKTEERRYKGGRKTRKRRGGNPDDKKKTYEKKLEDYENELADHNKTVDDSSAPDPPRKRPSWASPTASGWAVAPYNRTQVLVAPEPPIDPSAGPAARPAAEDNDGPAARPAAEDNENYRTNQFDGPIRGPPLTQEEMEEYERNLREIREREEDEAYERWAEQDSEIRGLSGRRW